MVSPNYLSYGRFMTLQVFETMFFFLLRAFIGMPTSDVS